MNIEEALRRSRFIPSPAPAPDALDAARTLASRQQPNRQAQDDLAAARARRTGGAR
ncbi:hypothetical protein ABZ721_33075 [Streptomyces sp. NPDC006733]|uniref:hypothetical protein n=1 Tax=Streptomyces sp. NPDC006733 TaxID=3155460 RepID=UPI0033DE4DAE